MDAQDRTTPRYDGKFAFAVLSMFSSVNQTLSPFVIHCMHFPAPGKGLKLVRSHMAVKEMLTQYEKAEAAKKIGKEKQVRSCIPI